LGLKREAARRGLWLVIVGWRGFEVANVRGARSHVKWALKAAWNSEALWPAWPERE
jgi:hypothetical protein